MKRLYEVNGEFFDLKDKAKVARGPKIKEGTKADPNVFGSKSMPPTYKFQVKRGPDHRHYQK
jgi:hypothetical protein